jgi:hypothetical protein
MGIAKSRDTDFNTIGNIPRRLRQSATTLPAGSIRVHTAPRYPYNSVIAFVAFSMQQNADRAFAFELMTAALMLPATTDRIVSTPRETP